MRYGEASTIATTIADQIGGRALYMMGARDLVALDSGRTLRFAVMRGARCTYVAVTLDPDDTYAVRTYTRALRPLRDVSGVYVDALRRVIGDVTGLAVSL